MKSTRHSPPKGIQVEVKDFWSGQKIKKLLLYARTLWSSNGYGRPGQPRFFGRFHVALSHLFVYKSQNFVPIVRLTRALCGSVLGGLCKDRWGVVHVCPCALCGSFRQHSKKCGFGLWLVGHPWATATNARDSICLSNPGGNFLGGGLFKVDVFRVEVILGGSCPEGCSRS